MKRTTRTKSIRRAGTSISSKSPKTRNPSLKRSKSPKSRNLSLKRSKSPKSRSKSPKSRSKSPKTRGKSPKHIRKTAIKSKSGANERDFRITNVKLLPGKKKDIVSVAYFTFLNAYNPASYYGNGILKLHELLINANKKHNVNFLLRVYYDDTIEKFGNEESKQILDKLKTMELMELVHVDISDYTDINTPGVFSAILRYLPMFNREDTDTNFIYVMDSDSTMESIELANTILETFIKMYKSGADFCFNKMPYYDSYWFDKLFPNSTAVSILGWGIGGTIKVSYNILKSFLNSYINKSDLLMKKYIKVGLSIYSKTKVTATIDKQATTLYPYMFDEFFLTCYFFKECVKLASNVQAYTYQLHSITAMLNHAFPEDNKVVTDLFNVFARTNKLKVNWRQFKYIFKPHDYANKKPETHTLYLKFHRYLLDNLSAYKKNADPLVLNGLVRYDRYITDFNNVIKLSAEEIKRIYRDILTY